MKKLIYVLALFCFVVVTGQAMAYSVSLTPSVQTIGSGGTALINVDLSVGATEALFGFDFDLGFNSAVLGFNNLSVNSVLSDYVTGYDQPSAGNPDLVTFDGALDLSGTNMLTDGTFTLATLSFTGLGPGSSPLNLSGTVLDINPDTFLVPVGATGTVNVPEPGILLLVGMGIAGLAGFRKSQKLDMTGGAVNNRVCETRGTDETL